MSEDCDAYAMFIFLPEVPVSFYVQAVPDLSDHQSLQVGYPLLMIANTTLLVMFSLSIKRKLTGENGNYVSVEA